MSNGEAYKIAKPWPIGALWYWLIIVAVVATSIGPFYYLVAPFKQEIRDWFGVNWFVAFLAIWTLCLLSGISSQEADEWRVKLIAGRPIQVSDHGPIHVLWPIFSFVSLPKKTIQHQYPAENDEIDWERATDEGVASDRKVAPIRVTTAAGTKEEVAEDVLHRRMTLNISIAVTYRILDPVQFLLVLGKPGGEGMASKSGLENARQQIEDVAVGRLTAAIGDMTAANIIKGISSLDMILEARVQNLVCGTKPGRNSEGIPTGAEERDESSAWGAEVTGARIVRYDLPRTVNQALRDVAKATLTAKSIVIGAEAERQKLTLEGEGAATAEEALKRATLAGLANGIRLAEGRPLNEGDALTREEAIALLTALALAKSDNTKVVLGGDILAKLPGEIARAFSRNSS